MIDPFSRILVCERKEPLKSFSRAQEALTKAEAAEVAAFNVYGPKDRRFLERLLDLADAQQTAKEYGRSLESGIALDRYAKETGFISLRLENFYMIIQNELAQRNIIEADEISTAVMKEMRNAIASQWSVYWRLKFLSLHADIFQEKGQLALEMNTRMEAFTAFSKELGETLYETMLLRLYLGECRERCRVWEEALGDYETVYATFQLQGLFSSAEEKVSLLARRYRCLVHLGDGQRALETRIWILNSIKRSFAPGSVQRLQILSFLKNSRREAAGDSSSERDEKSNRL
ncbi:MAG: hypothetical protein WCQ66_01385 [Sphaerochaetaceae bacterium]